MSPALRRGTFTLSICFLKRIFRGSRTFFNDGRFIRALLRVLALGSAAQHNHVVGHDIGEIFFLAVLPLVGVVIKAPFKIHFVPLFQVSGHVLAQLVPADYGMEVRFAFCLAAFLVFPLVVGGQGYFGYALSGG